jgi:hypothetical protein
MSNLTPRIDKLETNHVINGAFDFWQRGTSLTFSATTSGSSYLADRWRSEFSSTGNSTIAITRSTDVPTASTTNPVYSMLTTVTTAGSFTGGSYFIPFGHYIEGNFFRNLHKNTMTVQFWIKASLAGTYSIALRNGPTNRYYATTFTISSPATWTFISKVIQLDQAGTWNLDNTTGIQMFIASYAATTFTASSNDTWLAGNAIAASGVTNWFVTGATVQLAEVAVYKGDLGNSASTAASTAFKLAGRNYGNELTLCQRYYFKLADIATWSGTNEAVSNNVCLMGIPYPVRMRAVPTISLGNLTVTQPQILTRPVTGFNTITDTYANNATFNASGYTQGASLYVAGSGFAADAEL